MSSSNFKMSNPSRVHGGYDGPQETKEERRKKIDALNISVRSLFDPSQPWILVENGSILGYFDWVPAHLRVGPWQPYAPAAVLFFLFLAPLLVNLLEEKTKVSITYLTQQTYPEYSSALWFYNLLGFIWITGISLSVFRGPAGILAWGTYSMWTWTVLNIRYGLVTVYPFLNQSNSLLISILELSRFPMLLMCTMTFVVWNFILM